jgi:hypothetical protein
MMREEKKDTNPLWCPFVCPFGNIIIKEKHFMVHHIMHYHLPTHMIQKEMRQIAELIVEGMILKHRMKTRMDELRAEYDRSAAYAIDNSAIRMGYHMTIEELEKLVEHS